MRWKQTGHDTWGLFVVSDFAGMPVELRVALVKERTMGLTTRRYEVALTKSVVPTAMMFWTLEEAQVWAQTTYRLTK